MADILLTTKIAISDKCPAPEALDCCVQTCLLRPIAPGTPPDRFIHKTAAKIKQKDRWAPAMEESCATKPKCPKPESHIYRR